jgi:hypothetical protein
VIGGNLGCPGGFGRQFAAEIVQQKILRKIPKLTVPLSVRSTRRALKRLLSRDRRSRKCGLFPAKHRVTQAITHWYPHDGRNH